MFQRIHLIWAWRALLATRSRELPAWGTAWAQVWDGDRNRPGIRSTEGLGNNMAVTQERKRGYAST